MRCTLNVVEMPESLDIISKFHCRLRGGGYKWLSNLRKIARGFSMRFILTLSMASFSNNLVHQIICDHPANSLDDLTDLLNDTDFITVEQYYNVKDENSGDRT